MRNPYKYKYSESGHYMNNRPTSHANVRALASIFSIRLGRGEVESLAIELLDVPDISPLYYTQPVV